jgi:hypothetical protein
VKLSQEHIRYVAKVERLYNILGVPEMKVVGDYFKFVSWAFCYRNPVRIAPGQRIEPEKSLIRNFYALRSSVYAVENLFKVSFLSLVGVRRKAVIIILLRHYTSTNLDRGLP